MTWGVFRFFKRFSFGVGIILVSNGGMTAHEFGSSSIHLQKTTVADSSDLASPDFVVQDTLSLNREHETKGLNQGDLEKWKVFVVSVGIMLLGFLRLTRRRNEISKRHTASDTYLKEYQKYFASNGQDLKTYTWLIKKGPSLQNQMGYDGLLQSYKPAYKNVMMHKYQIIVSLIPDLHDELHNYTYADARTIKQLSNMIQESLLRHAGRLEDDLSKIFASLRNPIIWFREGVQLIILIPVTLLYWFGD